MNFSLKVLALVINSSIVSLGGTYLYNLETYLDKLQDVVLPVNAIEDYGQILGKSGNFTEDSGNSSALNQLIKDVNEINEEISKDSSSTSTIVKTSHTTSEEGDEEEDENLLFVKKVYVIRDGCSTRYGHVFRSIFTSPDDYKKKILEEIKKICTLSIKSALEISDETKTLESVSKKYHKTGTKVTQLNTKIKNYYGQKRHKPHPALKEFLEKVPLESSQEAEGIKKGCENAYKQSFLGENDMMYIAAREMCGEAEHSESKSRKTKTTRKR